MGRTLGRLGVRGEGSESAAFLIIFFLRPQLNYLLYQLTLSLESGKFGTTNVINGFNTFPRKFRNLLLPLPEKAPPTPTLSLLPPIISHR